MNLEAINNVTALEATKQTVSWSELPVGVALPIVGARLISGNFGDTILLELTENSVFLPKRCTAVLQDHLDQFIPDAYSLIYLGQKIYKQHSTPIFKIIKI